MEHPIGALPRTPFASSRRSPQGETRSMERKNRESYISCTIPVFSPFGGWRHHLPPAKAVGLWVLSNGAMFLQESIERFILSPGWGGKGTRFVREQSDLRIV